MEYGGIKAEIGGSNKRHLSTHSESDEQSRNDEHVRDVEVRYSQHSMKHQDQFSLSAIALTRFEGTCRVSINSY